MILKKNELLWQELHRVKELFVGFYNTLKTYTAVLKGRPVGYLQTIESGRQKIYLVDLPSGEVKDLYQTGPGESMAISKVLPNGDILG